MSSDVCKHCTHAACLDVCPTGALFRTEFGTVVVQQDVCNGCGYCVPACPFGVIDRREPTTCRKPDEDVLGLGRAQVHALLRPAEGRDGARLRAGVPDRVDPVRLARGVARPRATARRATARAGRRRSGALGESPDDGVGGFGAFFLLLDKPEVYGLPPDPIVPTRRLPEIWGAALLAGAALAGSVLAAVAGGGR